MGILSSIKNIVQKKNAATSTNKLLSTSNNQLCKDDLRIHSDLVDLIWIGDGPYRNYQDHKEEHIVYPYDGFSVKVSILGTDEPSLLYLKLPIQKPANPILIERPPYYPYYRELTPEQKWLYWNFLNDPYNPSNDIGYVFIFYYGLERHLMQGNFEKAFDVILKLRDVYKNKSFQLYSSSALVLSAMIHKRPDYATKFIESLDKDYEFIIPDHLYFLCKLGLDMPITVFDIMHFHNFFGFTNNRYIKNNTDLFAENLKENIIKLTNGQEVIYARNYFTQSDIATLKTVSIRIFANLSISDKEITIPDISSPSRFIGNIYAILVKTHEDTKRELALMRKTTKTSRQTSTLENKTTTSSKKNETVLPTFDPKQLPYNIEKELYDPENIDQLITDINLLNRYINEARKLAKIRTKFKLKIEDMNLEGKNENGSYWELSPYTKTGRLAKYPLTIYYRTNHWNDFSDSEKYWGSISYLKNGTIGKAELINWINGKMYSIKLGIVKNELDVKLVETLNKQGIRVTAYKHR